MANYLVAGMNGFIGGALFNHFKSIFAAVCGTTRRVDHAKHPIYYLNLFEHSNQWKLPDLIFDVAFICTGVCQLSTCEDDPVLTRMVNVTRTIELIQLLSQRGTFIVYLSSNQVFSGSEPWVPVTANYKPINEYGRQKVNIEKWIKTNCKHWAIVRLTKVIPPKMPLLQDWSQKLMLNLPIEAFNDMMLAPVTLRQVIAVLLKIGQTKKEGYYHVSGIEDVSYFDLAKYLAKYLGQSEDLVKPIAALTQGVRKIFLPRFTSLDCFDTMDFCQIQSPLYHEVIKESIEHIRKDKCKIQPI